MTIKNLTKDSVTSLQHGVAITRVRETNTSPAINILMVEDDVFYFRFVEKILSATSLDVTFNLMSAISISSAREILAKDAFDVVIPSLPGHGFSGRLHRRKRQCRDSVKSVLGVVADDSPVPGIRVGSFDLLGPP